MTKEHIKLLRKVNKDLTFVERLTGGMSNYTYLVTDSSSKKFVFRVIGEHGENFTNFKAEKSNLNTISGLDINSETIYYDNKSGTKLSTYIEGSVKYKDLDYKAIAKLLKKLHNSEIKLATNYGHLKRLEEYEKLHDNFDNSYYELKEKFLDVFNKVLKKHILYPCHNDAQLGNIVSNKSKYYLLDWEFTGTNDYIYDIACFGNRDFDMSIKLLSIYETDLEFDHVIRLYGWRMFQCLQWFNVASAKHKFGLSPKLNIDFRLVADNYLKLAIEMSKNLKKYK